MKYLNLADMFFCQRENLTKHPAYQFKSKGQWHTVTFGEAVEQTHRNPFFSPKYN